MRTLPSRADFLYPTSLLKSIRYLFALFLASAGLVSGALATDILTNRGDNARTGLNPNEPFLNPTNVQSLGLLYNKPVDGLVYAQPLYVSGQQVTANNQTIVANVVYVATEHDTVYAFDADTGALYWHTSLLLSGEAPVLSTDVNCDDLVPEIGITATPVIDRSAGPHGTIFVLASSKNAAGTSFFHRLHAIDLTTGQDRLTPRVIAASVSGTGVATAFVALNQRCRAGLLLLNGIIYTSWGSYCDTQLPYAGWLIAYRETDLVQTAVLNTAPNGQLGSPGTNGSGNGIWQDGNGPAADANGNIYIATGNGPFDTPLNAKGFPPQNDFGDSVLKLSSTSAPSIAVTDYFAPFDQLADQSNDQDLGSAGPMVLPDIVDTNGTHHHLLVQSGKDWNLYLLDRDNLGKWNSGGESNSQIYQELSAAITNGAWSSPAYFNGSVYFGGQSAALSQFQFNSQAKLNLASSSTTAQFGYPGTTPTISSKGTSNGIVWAYERATPPVLHAYDPTNLAHELFNSSSFNIGTGVKFTVPTVCNGKVFVGTSNSMAAFSLLGATGSGVAKDFYDDRFADLIWENTANGQRAIWLMIDGVFQSMINLGVVDLSWHIAGVGDFLGNGQSDLLWENTTTGARAIWILNNGSFVSSINLGTVSTAWHMAGAGDFDGDGQADIVWENSVTGQRAIWFLKNGVYSSNISLPTMSTQWHIAAVADFNGDGQADLVWENTVTGQRAIWFLKNGVFSSSISLPTISTQWHIAGAADFNGDGQTDLVWQNPSTGERAIWFMQNGVPVSTISLGKVPTQWNIVDH